MITVKMVRRESGGKKKSQHSLLCNCTGAKSEPGSRGMMSSPSSYSRQARSTSANQHPRVAGWKLSPCSSPSDILHRSTISPITGRLRQPSQPTALTPPVGQINREPQRKKAKRTRKERERERETRGVFWSDGRRDVEWPCYDACVVSVGAGVSVANVGAVSLGSVASAAAAGSVAGVTVTEAVGAAVDMGRSGTAPWGRSGGSWDGSIVGRGGNGVRPGMFRGGKDEKDGTERKKRGRGRERERDEVLFCLVFGIVQLLRSDFCDVTKGIICAHHLLLQERLSCFTCGSDRLSR